MMTLDPRNAPPAALIVLLALGTELTNRRGPTPSRARISMSKRTISLQEAGEWLDALPKPVGISGSLRENVMIIERDEALTATARVLLPRIRAGAFDFLRERYGDPIDELVVVCFGAGTYLTVSLADLRAFEQDYFLAEAGNCGMDFADSSDLEEKGMDSARLSGAHAYVSFGSR
jgi:hypothetical protein